MATVRPLVHLGGGRIGHLLPGDTLPVDYADLTGKPSVLQRPNLIWNGYGEAGSNANMTGAWYTPVFVPGGGPNRENLFRLTGPFAPLEVKANLVLNMNRQYRFSAQMMAGNPDGTGYDPAGRIYMGFFCYDADYFAIINEFCWRIAGTETKLTAPLITGDTSMKLISAANWNNDPANGPNYARGLIWYNYKDYPDYTYSRNTTMSMPGMDGASGGAWAGSGVNLASNTITLRQPWPGPNIPAGTAVANYTGGDNLSYLRTNMVIPNRLTNVSGVFGGRVGLSGINDNNNDDPVTSIPAFRSGTAYVRPFVGTNYFSSNPTCTFNITALSLEEIEPVGIRQYTPTSDYDPNLSIGEASVDNANWYVKTPSGLVKRLSLLSLSGL